MATDGYSVALQSVSEQKRPFKLLFLGDSDCGKTRIVQTYLQNNVPRAATHDTLSTCYEYSLVGSKVSFTLMDVRGTTNIAKASTRFNFPDVALFMYAINDPRSLENVRYQWLPRFRMCSGLGVPTILVGNKKDLRASGGLKSIASQQPVSLSFFDGMKVKTCCSMDMFLECSAEDNESVLCLFQAAYSYVI